MVTQQTMVINSARAMVKASSSLAFSLRFLGISKLLRVNNSGVNNSFSSFRYSISNNTNAGLGCVPEDHHKLNRAYDEPVELKVLQSWNVIDPFLKARDRRLLNVGGDLVASHRA